MPLPKAIRGKLLFIQSLLITGILLSLVVYNQLTLPGGDVGQISNSDNVLGSPLWAANFTGVTTGEVNGTHNADGSFVYDLGIFVANNSTIERTAGSPDGIPVYVNAWISYCTTGQLTANAGYIRYESINVSYMSSYNYFEKGVFYKPLGKVQPNSYASSVSGGFQQQKSGVVTASQTVMGFQNTPKPEVNVVENRTYSQTLPHQSYSYGISLPGQWILSNGPQNNNTLAFSVTEKVGLVTSVSSGFTEKTLRETQIVLETVFLVKYVPNSAGWQNGASVTGGSYVPGLGQGTSTNVSSMSYRVVDIPYF